VGEGENLNPKNGRGKRRVRTKENFLKKIGRRRGTMRMRENFKKKKMVEGEEEWERGRGRVRERMSIEKIIKRRGRGTLRKRERYKNPKQKKNGREG
jgi:hypothetical protein